MRHPKKYSWTRTNYIDFPIILLLLTLSQGFPELAFVGGVAMVPGGDAADPVDAGSKGVANITMALGVEMIISKLMIGLITK